MTTLPPPAAEQLGFDLLTPWVQMDPRPNFVTIHQLRESFVNETRTLAHFTSAMRWLQDIGILQRIRDNDLQIHHDLWFQHFPASPQG
jgi:hypothetical protein